jgi:hypothetical protein
MKNETNYYKLLDDCKKINNQENRYAVDYIIDSARINADDTIIEGNATESDWDRLFVGTIGSQLSTGEYNHHVVKFFTNRGIEY